MGFTLRKWRDTDAPALASAANNPKIYRNLRDAMPSPYTLEDARDYIHVCVNADESLKLLRAIDINGRAVGSIGVFVGSDVYRKCAELGYWLAEEYWGRGITTEAVGQICREAFEKLDIARIYAEPFARNAGSRRVLEKNGFQLEGVMKMAAFKDGEYLDWCMYALLK